MESLLISIIIPVYNTEKYLEECINSVLLQTYLNLEIILVDDGSKDSSGAICDLYKNKDERIKVIHRENGGSSDARNAGIKIAKGDYILFLDSDDFYISNNVIETIVYKLHEYYPDVLSFNFKKVYENSTCKAYFKQTIEMGDLKSLKNQIDNNIWIACAWNKAIRRNVFMKNDLFFIDGITSEDIDWCLRLSLYANSFDYLEDVIVAYRQRNESISNAINYKKVSCLLNNIKKCLTLNNHSEDKLKKEQLKKYIGYQYATLLYNISLLKNKNERYKILKEAEKYKYILEWSNVKKAKIMVYFSKMFGFKSLILAFRFMDCIKEKVKK